eukprot:8128224-Alexandrium_andersonii.AAC.1
MANIGANADATNTQEPQREFLRVEIRLEEAEARLAQRAQQDAALLQNALQDAEGRRVAAQDRARELERRLGVAEGLLTDNDELGETAKAKDAQRADM